MQHVTVIGYGDIGGRVAKILSEKGYSLQLIMRNPERASVFKQQGAKVLLADLDKDYSAISNRDDLVFWFAPPPPSGREDLRVQRWLATLDENTLPKKIVLISTSGVYGDCGGAWVDESTVVNPQNDRTWRRLDAEQQLTRWAEQQNIPIVILRVPGIYGPGRWPLETIKRAQPVLQACEAPFSNRIHQDDLAQICVAAMLTPQAVGIINVSDGQESTMSEYFQAVAKAFSLPALKEINMEEAKQVLSAGMLSYLTESRRIDNSRMLQLLGITLRYPCLEDALAEEKPPM